MEQIGGGAERPSGESESLEGGPVPLVIRMIDGMLDQLASFLLSFFYFYF
jgi:hypothetical protein